MTQEHIRELCARVSNSQGEEFTLALQDLSEALELWGSVGKMNGDEKASEAGLHQSQSTPTLRSRFRKPAFAARFHRNGY